jgi:glycosyltransferase involved in cell wall biosynthesis
MDHRGGIRDVPDVILPVLDEAVALPWLLDRIPPGFTAIVVDNGSTDGSAAIASVLGARVVQEPRRGFGAACWAGLEAATDPIVCFMDADGSLHPADLVRIVEPIADRRADLVLGARRPTRGAWPAHARLANRALARRVRRDTGVALSDLGPMRAARRAALLDLGIRDRRFGWPLEMIVRAGRAGWRVEEVPVAYHRRRGGRSKVTGSWRGTITTVRDMTEVLRTCTSS